MKHKYRVEHYGLKDKTILDFPTLEEASTYARLTKKYMKIAGYPVHKVDIKVISVNITSDEEEND